ncbi:MAG TPA: transglutaminase domain-containing protein [Gemmataceae bacterium]|nr:transglutaminase domain-containing protein [Gemmataceae bacterium]
MDLLRNCLLVAGLALAGPVAMIPAAEPKPDARQPRSRTFDFTYSATVTGLRAGEKARVWLPVPPETPEQKVRIVSELPPGARVEREPKFGNRVLYLEAQAGDEGAIAVRMTYRVTRREVLGEGGRVGDDDMAALAKFLQADRMVPTAGKPLELLRGREVPADQVAAARLIYDVVNGHMRYSKEGTGWGRGDAVWACESGYGNCTDFHSLFLALARSRKIPAKFEIGFPLPEKRGEGEVPGYHCWAWFHPKGKGWVPVDISEANKSKDPKVREYYFGNLTENRVLFSTGRDIDLVPKPDGPPLNFFVYPYVEVSGRAYPAEKVRKKFTFRDVK